MTLKVGKSVHRRIVSTVGSISVSISTVDGKAAKAEIRGLIDVAIRADYEALHKLVEAIVEATTEAENPEREN